MNILLMVWSCLVVVSFFSCYIMIDMTGGDSLTYLIVAMLLAGIIFLYVVNHSYKKTIKANYVLHKGYEKYVFIATYIVVYSINILIISGLYTNISLTSPLIMLTWILPMISYSLYQSMWLCYDDTIHIKLARNLQKLSYQSIKKLTLNKTNKNNIEIIMTTKKEEFIYTSKEKYILHMKEFIITKNSKVEVLDKR